MSNRQDILRDPIWQFIGVIVGIVAIFMTFLTEPSFVQGTTLVMIVLSFIVFILLLTRNRTGHILLASIFFFLLSLITYAFVTGLTYDQLPFFKENFGLDAPGVIFAKSDIGLSLLVIEYILWATTFLLGSYLSVVKKRYMLLTSITLLFTSLLFFLIPSLYMPNFINIKVLTMDMSYPKTALGTVIYILCSLGFILLVLAPSKKSNSSSRKSP